MLVGHARFIVVSCGYETLESMDKITGRIFSDDANDLYGSNVQKKDDQLTK
jgi:hypothetical protein